MSELSVSFDNDDDDEDDEEKLRKSYSDLLTSPTTPLNVEKTTPIAQIATPPPSSSTPEPPLTSPAQRLHLHRPGPWVAENLAMKPFYTKPENDDDPRWNEGLGLGFDHPSLVRPDNDGILIRDNVHDQGAMGREAVGYGKGNGPRERQTRRWKRSLRTRWEERRKREEDKRREEDEEARRREEEVRERTELINYFERLLGEKY